MSVKFLNLKRKVISVRPTEYKYPVGLSQRPSLASGNAATNTTGGTQTIDGSNTVHTFTVSGTFTPSFTGNIEYLVVAGGGAGGGAVGDAGTGGGAGGLRRAGRARGELEHL